jgi:hypothetical protein
VTSEDRYTFSQLVSALIELESGIAEMYRAASERSQPGTLRELFLSFSRANMEHIKFLTKARRETVIEMLLEPITGLGLEEQVLRAKQMIADQNLDDRNKAIQLEQTVQDLYNKTSAKVATCQQTLANF